MYFLALWKERQRVLVNWFQNVVTNFSKIEYFMQDLNETFTEIKLWATLKARYCFMVPAQVRKYRIPGHLRYIFLTFIPPRV